MNCQPLLPLAFVAAAFATPAAAQDAPANPFAGIDPATITVPDLKFTPDKEATDNYWKYFIFHKDGVDFATAAADIAECEGYSKINDMFVQVPALVPMAPRRRARSTTRTRNMRCNTIPFTGFRRSAVAACVHRQRRVLPVDF